MIPWVRLLLTTLFAAGYLAQTLVLGVVHLHTGASFVCDGQISGRLVAGEQSGREHTHSGCHGSHECLPSDNQDDSGPRRAPAHDHDNCSICRHLVKQPISADAVRPPLVGEVVALVEFTLPVFYRVALPQTHFSRGPPAQCC